jgi:glucokinase
VPYGTDSTTDSAVAVGCEIGSRGLRAVLANQQGRILDSLHGIDTREHASITLNLLNQLVDQLLQRNELSQQHLAGIGVAFGGPVDTRRGLTIGSARYPGFDHYPLASLLEERFGVTALVENDARAAAVGEYQYGSGRGAQTMIYLQLGIGVGGGIVTEGTLLHGAGMIAGEFGHIAVSLDGPRCSCGKPGHLEAYVSEPALMNRMRERLADAPAETVRRWWAAPGVSLVRIFEEAERDSDAQAVVAEAIRMTGLATANLVTALNADALVLGGYAVELGQEYCAAVRSRIRQYAFDPAAKRVTVSLGQLGLDASVIGATYLAFVTSES